MFDDHNYPHSMFYIFVYLEINKSSSMEWFYELHMYVRMYVYMYS